MPPRPPPSERLREVRRILLLEWDPIGIYDEPACRDEYDKYADEVLALLERTPRPAVIAGYLAVVQREMMGMDRINEACDEIVAKKLCALVAAT